MAKSLRSKWKRKMKQEKRQRYGKKELERLKTIVEKAKENDAQIASETDVAMAGDELYTVVTRPSRASRKRNKTSGDDDIGETQEVEKMEPDQGKIKIYDPETMTDQHGQLPVWVGSHMRKRLARINKKKKLMKKKREKQLNKKKKTR